MLETAVQRYDDEVLRSDDLRLRRLSGMMLINTGWVGVREPSNVEFCRTVYADSPLRGQVASALAAIRIGLP